MACLESWYWHCCEKWFCYDESIALWEDPDGNEHNHVGWDNMAYWDSIAVIANRAVVTIQPLTADVKATPEMITNNDLSAQLNLQDDLHRRLSEVFQYSSMLRDIPNSTSAESNRRVGFHLAPGDFANAASEVSNKKQFSEDRVDSGIEDNEYNISIESYKKSIIKNRNSESTSPRYPKSTDRQEKLKSDKLDKKEDQTSANELNAAPKILKRTEVGRSVNNRMSANENLKRPSLSKTESTKVFSVCLPPLEKRGTELRLIKQNSMPNFYIDTPDISENAPTLSADKILMSPVLPNTPQFTYDLRSIVEIEKNKPSTSSGPHIANVHKSGRLISMRKKLAPLVIKRPSSRQLTNTKQHDSNPS